MTCNKQELISKGSILAKLICTSSAGGKLQTSLWKIAGLCISLILIVGHSSHQLVESIYYGYPPLWIKLSLAAIIFAVAVSPILSVTIGFSERLEITLMSWRFPKPLTTTIVAATQSGAATAIAFGCTAAVNEDLTAIGYWVIFTIVLVLILGYQSTRDSTKNLTINKKWGNKASLHTSSKFNSHKIGMEKSEITDLISDAVLELSNLPERTKIVTMKSHLVTPAIHRLFSKELSKGTEWEADKELIRSHNFYSIFGLSMSTLGYLKNLGLKPTHKMTLRRKPNY